jgi:hypothetical protein
MKLLSIGYNQKLARCIPVFNLPRGLTCPGKTDICSRICYANKAQRLHPNVRAKRMANYKTSLTKYFVDAIIREIKGSGAGFMRWHESGDFYSQAYLNKVFAVCRACPEITFLAYTKSFRLDYSLLPQNLIIYFSVDPSTPTADLKRVTNLLQAVTIMRGGTVPAGFKTCPSKTESHYCGAECRVCWKKEGSVYFPEH